MRPKLSRKWRYAVFTWVVMVLAGGGVAYRNRGVAEGAYNEWYWQREFARGTGLRAELANGTFPVGSPVEDLIFARPPMFVVRDPIYTVACYRPYCSEDDDGWGHGPGEFTSVWARDGKIIGGRASSRFTGGEVTFFGRVGKDDLERPRTLPSTLESRSHFRNALSIVAGGAAICEAELR